MKKICLISIGKIEDKKYLLSAIKKLTLCKNTVVYATQKTHQFFKINGVKSQLIYKISEIGLVPNIADLLPSKVFNLIINIPTRKKIKIGSEYTDGKLIRKTAVTLGITLVTDPEVAMMTVDNIIKKMNEK